MLDQVLSQDQIRLLPLLSEFSSKFGLVGGTAIALQLGHRKSIDFDLFTNESFDPLLVRRIIRDKHKINQTIIESQVELTLVVDGVKMTFYSYPYQLEFDQPFKNYISTPSLATLAAMKAFALGRRAKWKDYVDMYFLIKELGFAEIINASKRMFKAEFNEKLLRTQLSYFADIDYSERVDYLIDNPPSEDEVVSFLKEISLDGFDK